MAEVLGQDAQGTVLLLRNLGLWNSGYHTKPEGSKVFDPNVANLDSQSLANEFGYWTSEYQRVSELFGFLRGQKGKQETELKRRWAVARNSVRERSRANAAEHGKAAIKYTAAEVNDLALVEDTTLKQAIDDLDSLNLLYYSIEEAKESIENIRATLSREITRRGDLVRSGV